MLQALNNENAHALEARGFEISEMTGFDDHSIPLFAHRDMGDKKIGDVVLKARVGNPDSLDNAEAVYLARKAHHGMFPWLPGEECMQRTFREFDGAEGATDQSVPAKGCRWCRVAC